MAAGNGKVQPQRKRTLRELWEALLVYLRPVVFLSQNFISRAGVVVATTFGITLVFSYASQLFGYVPSNPYAGIVIFVILPGIFVLGLLLIPLGIYRDFRRHKRMGSLPTR